MRNYKGLGAVMSYQNSGSAIEAGDIVVLGNRVGIAKIDIAASTGEGPIMLEGEFECPAVNDTAFVQGDQLYYDESEDKLTTVATDNIPAGIAFEPKAEAAAVCRLRLQPLWSAADAAGEPAAAVEPGGATTNIQLNDAGVFYGEAEFNYNKTTNVMTVGGPGQGKISIGGTTNSGKLYIENAGTEDLIPAISLRNGNDPTQYGFDFHAYSNTENGDFILKRVSGGVSTNVMRVLRDSDVVTFAGAINCASLNPTNGATGSFTAQSGETITVTDGIITAIV